MTKINNTKLITFIHFIVFPPFETPISSLITQCHVSGVGDGGNLCCTSSSFRKVKLSTMLSTSLGQSMDMLLGYILAPYGETAKESLD